MARPPVTYELAPGHFGHVHGTDAQGEFGEQIDVNVINEILGQAHLTTMTAGPGGLGYYELQEYFMRQREYMHDLDHSKREGRYSLVTTARGLAGVAYVKPAIPDELDISRSSRRRVPASQRIPEAVSADIIDFAVNPSMVNQGVGSLLLQLALAEYPDEARVNFQLLGPLGDSNLVENWLRKKYHFFRDGNDLAYGDPRRRIMGQVSVQVTTVISRWSAGEIRDEINYQPVTNTHLKLVEEPQTA